MAKLTNQNFADINFKHNRSLNYNLKLLANNKVTSHLISIQKLEKGFFLAEENKPVQGIYFILKGKVKIYNTEINQKTKVFRLASKGDIVGFSSLNAENYWSSAVALDEVRAYFINIESLKYILNNNTKLSLLFVNSLVLKLHDYELRQRYLNLFPAPERVIEALLLIASKFGEVTENGVEISDCTTRHEIASLANVSTENTIRILSALISKNYISVERKKITLKNREELINQLKQFCCLSRLSAAKTCYFDVFY